MFYSCRSDFAISLPLALICIRTHGLFGEKAWAAWKTQLLFSSEPARRLFITSFPQFQPCQECLRWHSCSRWRVRVCGVIWYLHVYIHIQDVRLLHTIIYCLLSLLSFKELKAWLNTTDQAASCWDGAWIIWKAYMKHGCGLDSGFLDEFLVKIVFYTSQAKLTHGR